jgi:hypothetical protein
MANTGRIPVVIVDYRNAQRFENIAFRLRSGRRRTIALANYAALAVFFCLLAAFDCGFAAAFFFAAQKAFILSACCLR